jgi:hypothetical protein
MTDVLVVGEGCEVFPVYVDQGLAIAGSNIEVFYTLSLIYYFDDSTTSNFLPMSRNSEERCRSC